MKLAVILSLVILTSCSVPWGVRAKFTMKYEDKKTDAGLQYNGYYISDGYSLMFFDNGLVTCGIHSLVQDGKITDKNALYHNLIWGTYKYNSDTFRIQMINGNGMAPNCFQDVLKLNNDNTIELISSEGLYLKYFTVNKPGVEHYIQPLKFVPLLDTVSSDNWFLKKRWFWKEKTDWKNYRKTRKKN
ncbi:MAG: hypothetical protein CVU05_02950 [Bacteroidetes bacterium HGW-Bacteroidetes-21]|nr:MAG: hypothetical protein CVU05_02950 [Bacteroidetes bacterium HGW-Bacteroidetes-21]